MFSIWRILCVWHAYCANSINLERIVFWINPSGFTDLTPLNYVLLLRKSWWHHHPWLNKMRGGVKISRSATQVLCFYLKHLFFTSSDEARALGFTVLVDMRGSTWSTVKPILKALHEHFPPGAVHQALIVKPDNFWQKQRTSLGSHKYKFEVRIFNIYLFLSK